MMLFFLIFVVLIALFLQKRAVEKGFDGLEGDHRPDRRVVEPGERFAMEITIRNTSKAILPFVKVRERLDSQVDVDETTISVTKDYRGMQTAEFTAWLRPKQAVNRSISMSISQRGRYVLNGLTLQCGDFLGLKEENKACGRFHEIVVAPEALPMAQLDEVLGGFFGDMSARRFIFDDPILTLGYSEYTGREPMKMISWTQSARRNTLLVKKQDYTLEPAVSILLNVETELQNQADVLEKCFSMARSVCEMMEQRNVRYSFVSNTRLAGNLDMQMSGEEGMGAAHFGGVLEHLGRATSEAVMPFGQLLQQEIRKPTAAGRILITPGGTELEHSLIHKLEEVSGGNLLVLKGTEVSS